MAITPLNSVIQHLIAICERDDAGLTDGELLTRFLSSRDNAALAALVQRHAPMVWGVCRRHLTQQQDAEDAFQATFLVLVRKAASVAPRDAVGNWLYGVAHKTGLRVRTANAKKARRERQVESMPDPPMPSSEDADLRHAIDAEIARLPDKYRAVVVLCDLQGLTRKEAAQRLGLPEGSVASRLTRARAMLGKRLVRLGVLATGVGMAACVPSPLMASTIHMAAKYSAGQAAGVVPAAVSALTKKVLFTMTMKKIMTGMLVLVAAITTGIGGMVVAQSKVVRPNQKDEKAKPAAEAADKKPSLSVIRLGVKRDDIISKYGKPSESETFVSGIESLRFQHSPDLRVLVEIDPKTKQAIVIFYQKKTPFTGVQITELLDRNAEGSKWWPVAVSGDEFTFLRLDRGNARGGSLGVEYQIAIYSGSVFRERDPKADAEREKAKESLKEVE